MSRLLLLTVCLCSAQAPVSDRVVDAVIARSPSIRDTPRIGLNLGVWTSWGAEQLSANVLMNPGFEGIIDRALVTVHDAGGDRFSDDTDWLARQPGFWNHAAFHVLTGRHAGANGTILRSGLSAGRASFQIADPLPGLAPGDIVAVSKTDDQQLPTQWWLTGSGHAVDPSSIRPGSPGRRSLRIPPSAAATSYLDAIGDRAGKLLPLHGEWALSIWVRSATASGKLRVQIDRAGSPAFLNVIVPLDTEWREYRWSIRPVDTGSPATLAVRFVNESDSADLWLDDTSFHPKTANPTGFRDEVVETLRTLRPGYLRDWQGQLGDTLSNRVAPAHARRATRYRPGGPDATEFAYSLPDFLALCHEIDANPWIVLPTTFSSAEWAEAGALLRAEADRYGFREVVVEFGNENWNELFRPAGILEAGALTEAAGTAFTRLLAGSGQDPRIRPVLSGSFSNLSQHETLWERTPPSILLAFAPYWAYDPQQPRAFFPDDHSRRLRTLSNRHQTAIYEMNAHSLSGSAPAETVNQILAAPATAAAMAWNAIGALEAGVERICIYTLAGFDTHGEGKGRLIHLFGITRDLAGPNRFRPEGDALVLFNQAIRGDYHAVETTSADVRAAAFAGEDGWRVLLVSRSASPRRVRLVFPNASGKASLRSLRLRRFEVDLPAFGIRLASPKEDPNER
jgi:hypothetical protein